MASLLTHPLVPITCALIAGRTRVSTRLLVAGLLLSMLPDFDVIGFKLHIAYGDPLGHRGASHSILFALCCALIGVTFARALHSTRICAFLFLALSTLSHGVLDAFTRQGLGVEFFWPFSDERFFFTFHPVESSPISISRFIHVRGLDVLQSELLWIWIPLFVICAFGYGVRRFIDARKTE